MGQILETAREGASTVHFPVRTDVKGSVAAPHAGANVIENVPELAHWLRGFNDQPMVLGVYIYADGRCMCRRRWQRM